MNNRQAGRRRGRGGQRQGGNPGRPDNGNRIDNRARGNAAQLLEKYKNLAQDAQRSGDRVTTEYYLQFADHYFRVLAESRARAEENGQARRPRDDEDDADGVEEFGYEGDIGSPAFYQQPVQRSSDDGERGEREDGRDRPRRDRNRDDDRPRQSRDDGQRDGQQRDGQQREGQQREGQRPRRDRQDGEGQRPRREASNDIGDERAPAPEPRDERPAPANDEPRRRGRPRRDAAPVANEGLDAAVLPPAISTEAPASDDAVERPRRGRPRKVRNDDEVVPPAA